MTAIVSPLSANGRNYEKSETGIFRCFITWWFVFWHYMLVAFNVAIQYVFIYYAWDVVQAKDGTMFCHEEQLLLIVCYLLFCSGIIKDTRESFAIALWLKEFPTSDTWKELEITEFDDGISEITSGMTIWYKWFVIIFIVLPKISIAVLLCLVGGIYLSRSETREELILNSVALFFVMEVDEMLWANLIPTEHQRITTEMPPIKSPLARIPWMLVLFTLVNGIATLASNGVLTAGLLMISCTMERYHGNDTVVGQ